MPLGALNPTMILCGFAVNQLCNRLHQDGVASALNRLTKRRFPGVGYAAGLTSGSLHIHLTKSVTTMRPMSGTNCAPQCKHMVRLGRHQPTMPDVQDFQTKTLAKYHIPAPRNTRYHSTC